MRSKGIAAVCALLVAGAAAARRAEVHEVAAAGASWSVKPLVAGLASLAQPKEQAGEYAAVGEPRRIRRRDKFADWAGRIVKPGVSLISEGGLRLVAKDLLSIGQRRDVWSASIVAPDGVETEVAVTVEPAVDTLERSQAMREAAIMERLSGGNVMQFYGWTEKSENVMLVSEPAGATLRNAVLEQGFEAVDVARRVSFAMDLVEGLGHMAEEGFVHRGISPESLMVVGSEPRPRLKIGDLSKACSAPDGPEEFRMTAKEQEADLVGSLAHRAREAWGGEWTHKADVYSAGLVLYQMLFQGDMPLALTYDVALDQMLEAAERDAVKSFDIWLVRVLSVMKAMLATDPAQRITAGEAYESLKQIAALPMRPRNSARVLQEARERHMRNYLPRSARGARRNSPSL